MDRDPYSVYDRQAAWAALVSVVLFGVVLVIVLPWWVTAGVAALVVLKSCVRVRIVRR